MNLARYCLQSNTIRGDVDRYFVDNGGRCLEHLAAYYICIVFVVTKSKYLPPNTIRYLRTKALKAPSALSALLTPLARQAFRGTSIVADVPNMLARFWLGKER